MSDMTGTQEQAGEGKGWEIVLDAYVLLLAAIITFLYILGTVYMIG